MAKKPTINRRQTMQQTSVAMDDDTRRKVLFVAAQNGETLSAFFRRAIKAELERAGMFAPLAPTNDWAD